MTAPVTVPQEPRRRNPFADLVAEERAEQRPNPFADLVAEERVSVDLDAGIDPIDRAERIPERDLSTEGEPRRRAIASGKLQLDPVVVTEPERPPLRRRFMDAVTGLVKEVRERPRETLGRMAADVITAPIASAQRAVAPSDPAVAEAENRRNRATPTYDRFGERRVYPTITAVSPKERKEAAVQTGANLAAAILGPTGGFVRNLGLASGIGAAYNPEDPQLGASLAAALITAPKVAAAPVRPIARYVRRAGDVSEGVVESAAGDMARASRGTSPVELSDAQLVDQFIADLERGAVEAGTAPPRGVRPDPESLPPEAQERADFAAFIEGGAAEAEALRRTRQRPPTLEVERPADVVQRQAETAARGIRRRAKPVETTEGAAEPAAEVVTRASRETAPIETEPPVTQPVTQQAAAAAAATRGVDVPDTPTLTPVERVVTRRIAEIDDQVRRATELGLDENAIEALRGERADLLPSLPRYPEGFTMGDPEPRVPVAPKRATGAEAPPVHADRATAAAIEQGELLAVRAAGADPLLDVAFGRTVETPKTLDEFFALGERPEPTPRSPESAALEIPSDVKGERGATVAATRKPREYINWRTWGERPSIMARIQQRAEELRASGDLEKGRVSFAEQRQLGDQFAKDLLADPLQIDRAKLKGLKGHEIVALKEVVQENTAIMESASRALNSGELSLDEVKAATLALDGARKATDEALATIVRESAEAGRTLGGLRQMARQTLDPEVWTVHAKRLYGDRPLPDAVLLEIRKLATEAKAVCGGPS